jgi:glycosyltransferase involved in cell wall biosynthesis
MVIVSEVFNDGRLRRAATAAAEGGYRVTVVHPDYHHIPKDLHWSDHVVFVRLPPSYFSFIHRFPYVFGTKLLDALVGFRPTVLHCHDLWMAVVGMIAGKRTGALVVVDNHEWFSENVTFSSRRNAWVPHPRRKKLIYRFTEWLTFRQADAVLNVCDSIADEMRAFYRTERRSPIFRNIPFHEGEDRPASDLRSQVSVSDDQFLLLWQGGLGPTRLVEPIIEALVDAPKAFLVLRGNESEQCRGSYMNLAGSLGVERRVVVLAAVPAANVVAEAKSADAGIWSLPNFGKNFYYALPNKIFTYIAAGLPVLGARYPEVRRIIETHEIGICFDPYDPKSIARAINRMIEDPEFHATCRRNTAKAKAAFDGSREWLRLPRLYDDLISGERI